ncbi:MAG: MurR/RpiR family transcriptional regulator [Clostridia bacterium]
MDALFTIIEQIYPQLSKGQRRIAEFIVDCYDDAAFMTAAKLGERVSVSESTVVRFAYALGLDGYPALQESLQELVRHRLTSVQRIRLAANIPQQEVLKTVLTADMNNIRSTIDMLDNDSFQGAIEAILGARRIYVLGIRSAMALAQFFTYYLDYVCDNVMFVNGAVQDIHERMLRVGSDDVCFGISFPRYSARTVDAMKYAKSKGATLIALTDQTSSPLAAISDYTLCAHSDMASFADSLVAPLALLDAIIVAVGLARKDEAYQHLTQLENIWHAEGVYLNETIKEERNRK